MFRWLHILVGLAAASLQSRRNLLLENIALRHQLLVMSRKAKRPRWNVVEEKLQHLGGGKAPAPATTTPSTTARPQPRGKSRCCSPCGRYWHRSEPGTGSTLHAGIKGAQIDRTGNQRLAERQHRPGESRSSRGSEACMSSPVLWCLKLRTDRGAENPRLPQPPQLRPTIALHVTYRGAGDR